VLGARREQVLGCDRRSFFSLQCRQLRSSLALPQAPKPDTRQLQRHLPVVQVAFQTAPGLVTGGDEARARTDQWHQIGELGGAVIIA
jgi:hypothetical protein